MDDRNSNRSLRVHNCSLMFASNGLFKSSSSYLLEKITKLVTRHHADDADAIIEFGDSCGAAVKRQMENDVLEEILNTDQFGLKL